MTFYVGGPHAGHNVRNEKTANLNSSHVLQIGRERIEL